MTTIGYWEASTFLLDSYTAELLCEETPVYSKEDHFLKIQQSSILEKVVSIARLIFHHLRALIFSSYKNDFMERAQRVAKAFRAVEDQEGVGKVIEKNMSKPFAQAWDALVKKEWIAKPYLFMGKIFIPLNAPVKLSVSSDEKKLLGGKIILILGAKKGKPTNLIKFYFKAETVTKDNKPENMDDGTFSKLLGQPIKRMIFETGFQSYVYYNGTWPFRGYYYPQMKEIGLIDEKHIIVKTGVEGLGSLGEEFRLLTLAQLKASWESGTPVDDEKTALVVKK